MARSGWFLTFLLSLVAAGSLAGAGSAAGIPNVTGLWGANATDRNWHFTTGGSGLETLHVTWGATPGSHQSLSGVFNGSLNGDTYDGTFQVSEGTVHVRGTMTVRVDSPAQVTVVLQPTQGSPGAYLGKSTVVLHGQGTAGGNADWKFQLTYAGDPLMGHGEGQSIDHLQGSIVDSGCVPWACQGCPEHPCAKPAITTPAISMKIDDASLAVAPLSVTPPEGLRATPPRERVLTLHVTVYSSTNTSLCPDGDTGQVVLTDRDLNTASGIDGSRFQIGGWSEPCAGHSYVLDATTTGAVYPEGGLGPGRFSVYVWIGCKGNGPPEGFGIGPAACEAG